jgi:hypothetical protein
MICRSGDAAIRERPGTGQQQPEPAVLIKCFTIKD